MIFLVAPPEAFTLFSSEEEKLEKFKQWGLSSPKAGGLRALSYSGFYEAAPVPCDVVGYVDELCVVLELPGGLHCIHPGCLAEMQEGRAEIGRAVASVRAAVELRRLPLTSKKQLAAFRDYVVLDFETTGFPPGAQIIEIGCVKAAGGVLCDSFSTLVNPRRRIPPGITRLTGITDGMVAAAPTLDQVVHELHGFIGGLPVVAHNAPFDLAFLKGAYETYLDTPQLIRYVDTVLLSRRAFPELENHKLETIIDRFGLSDGQSHRALDDARCTALHLADCIRTLLSD